jgi:hypothetical protein
MSDEERQTGAVSGTRVRVCYSDGLWYHGFIDSFHEPTGKYRISLDDGDRYLQVAARANAAALSYSFESPFPLVFFRIFALLPDPDVELLEPGAPGSKSGAAPVPAGRCSTFFVV